MTSKIDYVIAPRDTGGMRIQYRTKLVLPDAEHIHVTRNPDGSIKSAVPMEEAPESTHELVDGVWQWTSLWVDDPEDGAR